MKLRIPGAILLMGLLFGAITASTQNFSGNPADDQCVMCHVDTFNDGMAQLIKHEPFFERKCTYCHVVDAEQQLAAAQELLPITGEVVTQETLWRKRTVIPATTEAGREHLAILPGLDRAVSYRFQLVLNPNNDNQDKGAAQSLWLGLRPVDLANQGTASPFVITGLTKKVPAIVSNLEIYQQGETTVFLTWRTSAPVFSWVELETLDSADSAAATQKTAPASAKHPTLRDPEILTIEICYSCHSEGSLGTSHPVRLYARHGKTIIPRDLPTINDGMMTCVTCHGPHGSQGKQLVRETIKTKLCVACHVKFKGSSVNTTF